MVPLQSQTNSMRNVSNNIKNLKTKLKLRNNIHTKTFNGIRVDIQKKSKCILFTRRLRSYICSLASHFANINYRKNTKKFQRVSEEKI